MADLPRERLQERVFPFSNTGVDYFGPFEVKFMRKTMKRWCGLFTCLTTRAVHIEVVPSLEAETCLTAITRFIARRGKPATILSNNGTNFVGAAREMRDCINAWNQSDIETSLAQKDIKWKFNPPGAPHFGETIQMNLLRCMSMEDIFSEQKVRQLAPMMLCNKLQEITHRSPHKLPK